MRKSWNLYSAAPCGERQGGALLREEPSKLTSPTQARYWTFLGRKARKEGLAPAEPLLELQSVPELSCLPRVLIWSLALCKSGLHPKFAPIQISILKSMGMTNRSINFNRSTLE